MVFLIVFQIPMTIRFQALQSFFITHPTIPSTVRSFQPHPLLISLWWVTIQAISHLHRLMYLHGIIYAGAQKDLGPSGVTAVILSPWVVESQYVNTLRPGGLPSMLNYNLMVEKTSMFNTPNTFGIFTGSNASMVGGTRWSLLVTWAKPSESMIS